ncbi:MAG TPA: hypothetical protein PKE40_12310 [Arachnia sp.]|nr:hypothetical protein [Arachnia sp.]HMT87128.1 hypothetical protein [Arachnia sp.]
MLAGILIAVLVIAVLALGLPWVLEATAHDRHLDDDPAERFAESMRILRRDVSDYAEQIDAATVSTPLTRRAQLAELRLLQHGAAVRRAVVMGVLAAATVAFAVLAALNVVAWWSLLIPGGLLVAFVAVARFSVVVMQRDLDERATAVRNGYSESEPTVVLDVEEERSASTEISVDLSAPLATGPIWDPIPVTGPENYMSKPLLPRTVRTIDLSAPVAPASPFVPTADDPREVVGEDEVPASDTGSLRAFRPRAVGE